MLCIYNKKFPWLHIKSYHLVVNKVTALWNVAQKQLAVNNQKVTAPITCHAKIENNKVTLPAQLSPLL